MLNTICEKSADEIKWQRYVIFFFSIKSDEMCIYMCGIDSLLYEIKVNVI